MTPAQRDVLSLLARGCLLWRSKGASHYRLVGKGFEPRTITAATVDALHTAGFLELKPKPPPGRFSLRRWTDRIYQISAAGKDAA